MYIFFWKNAVEIAMILYYYYYVYFQKIFLNCYKNVLVFLHI